MIKEDIQSLLIKVSGLKKRIETTDEASLKDEKEILNDEKQQLNILIRNKNLQKKYPHYLKLVKLYNTLPEVIAVIIVIIMIIILPYFINYFMLTHFIIFLAPILGITAYTYLEKYYNKKIKQLNNIKPYYDKYGDNPFNQELVQKQIEELKNQITKVDEKINNHQFRLDILNKWQQLETKLLSNLTNQQYDDELKKIYTNFAELAEKDKKENPNLKIYMKN